MVKFIGTWAVEWSEEQKAFHIQTLSAMLARNARAFIEKRQNDFVCIGVAETREDANEIVEKFKQYRPDRNA